jgi:predicted nicotinamide N-methyase
MAETSNSTGIPAEYQAELEQLQQNYRLKTIRVQLENRNLELIKVANMDELLDRITHEDELPFWAEIWPAAIGLADFIFKNRLIFDGKQVLELGAGVGLSGMAAILSGARVTQSDFIAAAFSFIRVNCFRNQVPLADFLLGDWRNFPDVGAEFDIIMGADILYEKTVHADLRQVFKRVLKPGGAVILSDPGRRYGQQFIAELTGEGWENQTVQIPVFYEEQNYTIDIYQLTFPGNRTGSDPL